LTSGTRLAIEYIVLFKHIRLLVCNTSLRQYRAR